MQVEETVRRHDTQSWVIKDYLVVLCKHEVFVEVPSYLNICRNGFNQDTALHAAMNRICLYFYILYYRLKQKLQLKTFHFFRRILKFEKM